MTPAFSARRRADEFEALVSSTSPAPLDERDARAFAELLAVVDDLRAVPEVTARREFVADLREQLMAAADTALVPTTGTAAPPTTPAVEPLRSPRHRRRLSVLLGGAALVGATATVAVAAQTAIPGESLYPVKRGIESAQLQFVSGPSRGSAQLANAADRLTELGALSQQGDDARTAALAANTLETFSEQADEGVELLLQGYAETDDRALVAQVHDFNVTSMSQLNDLEARLPEESVTALADAADVLVDLDARATQACVVCDGGLAHLPLPRGLETVLGTLAPPQPVPGVAGTGQEVDEVVVPELDVPPLETPESLRTPALPTPATSTPSPSATKTPEKILSGTTEKVEETLKGTGETLKGTGETVEGTTKVLEDVTNGLTGTVGGVTNGTIDDVTEWVDLLNGATEPQEGTTPPNPLPGPLLPDSPLP